jgi:putative cardiolipin synthase
LNPRTDDGAGSSAWLASARRTLTAVLTLACGALCGCASLPPLDRAAAASEAIPPSRATTLGRLAGNFPRAADQSGFRLLPLGQYSLDTRVQLARRAEVSIDAQYYHWEDDETGRWLLRALRDAALRGVRVRLLLDDFYTHDRKQQLFLAFAAHPNVEVRLFNPFCCLRDQGQAARYLASVGDWKRVNHRMHNKLLIADGAMAVIGGRNVANEYFRRGSKDSNFIDLDAFTVGFVVEPLQGLFDRYWNADAVYPIQTVAQSSMTAPALRDWFEQRTGREQTPAPEPLPPADVLGYGPLADDLDDGRLGLVLADAYVFADHPDKPFDGEAGGELQDTSVTFNVFEALRMARGEVVISSPYLVPGDTGMALLGELRGRDVRVVAMTNSLGATDEPLVHIGYSKYRDPMLQLGVDLYEISASRTQRNRRQNLFGASLGRLHAKLAVVDRETIFVGSMNLDPRSATINTELGAVILSPQLARELMRVIDIDRLESAYRLRLGPDGQCQWLGHDGEQEVVLTNEPDTTLWLRLKPLLLRPFVPEALL